MSSSRPGSRIDSNVYLQSLVALFYDTDQLRGEEVQLTQTAEARQALSIISSRFAGLYREATKPEDFLESTSTFKPFIACKVEEKDKDMTIELAEPLRAVLLEKVVNPMLQYQEGHTIRVNTFLKQMFDILPNGDIKFSQNLEAGGRQAVDYYAAVARNMLIDYYSKSEAFFIRGTMIIEQAKLGVDYRIL